MAVNSTVTEDTQTLAGKTFAVPVAQPEGITVQPAVEGFSIRSLLGRGPGGTKPQS